MRASDTVSLKFETSLTKTCPQYQVNQSSSNVSMYPSQLLFSVHSYWAKANATSVFRKCKKKRKIVALAYFFVRYESTHKAYLHWKKVPRCEPLSSKIDQLSLLESTTVSRPTPLCGISKNENDVAFRVHS